MTFLSSIFSCCEPNRKAIEAEAETRRARIVAVYDQSYNRSLSSLHNGDTSMPPPKYSEIAADRMVVIPVDEKSSNPLIVTDTQLNVTQHRRRSPAPTFSDRSSIISIPSTRLSGITSTYTGRTVRAQRLHDLSRQDDDGSSWRDSGIYSDYSSSAPPSYQADGSVLGNDEVYHDDESHPVMADGWLERLRHEAEARYERQSD